MLALGESMATVTCFVVPSISGVHVAWVVDGKRIPLVHPMQVYPGVRLEIGFEYQPQSVVALIETSIDGRKAVYSQRAI